jgi:hypothetical protein
VGAGLSGEWLLKLRAVLPVVTLLQILQVCLSASSATRLPRVSEGEGEGGGDDGSGTVAGSRGRCRASQCCRLIQFGAVDLLISATELLIIAAELLITAARSLADIALPNRNSAAVNSNWAALIISH